MQIEEFFKIRVGSAISCFKPSDVRRESSCAPSVVVISWFHHFLKLASKSPISSTGRDSRKYLYTRPLLTLPRWSFLTNCNLRYSVARYQTTLMNLGAIRICKSYQICWLCCTPWHLFFRKYVQWCLVL